MLKRPLISVLTAVLLMLFLLRVAIAGNATGYPRRPKLVLILVIDQFRYDYLVRFRQRFVAGGFNLLLNGGANFADCRYDYATTTTGPGHATLLTGRTRTYTESSETNGTSQHFTERSIVSRI